MQIIIPAFQCFKSPQLAPFVITLSVKCWGKTDVAMCDVPTLVMGADEAGGAL